MAKIVNIKSTYTLTCIRDGLTYKDYALEYNKLTKEEKQKIVSLLSD